MLEGICRSDPGECLIHANQSFADMFGYKSPEAIKAAYPVELYVRPERRTELRDRLRREGRFKTMRSSAVQGRIDVYSPPKRHDSAG